MSAAELWTGEFGDAYQRRNATTPDKITARTWLWHSIFERVSIPETVLEVGAGDGVNLRAIDGYVMGQRPLRLHAVEPNMAARTRLLRNFDAVDGTAQALPFADASIDLVFTSGVLIHIPPRDLAQACAEIHRVSRRYIVAIEYFAAEPTEVPYRGHAGALWKRDFGAFYLDHFPDLKALGCGFAWKRTTGLDDLTWWAFEKCT